MAVGKGHHARPLFLPHRQTFVAARPFCWKGEQLEAGDAVPKEWPLYHLRHLHAQSLIGPKGHPWTKGRQASWAKKIADGKERRDARRQARFGRQVDEVEADVLEAELTEVEAVAAADEARTLRDRLAALFAWDGSSSAGSSSDDPA